MALTIIDGPTIQGGEALSDVADCSAGRLVRITMPADWTDAPLTFQISSDGQYFNDLFDAEGREVTVMTTLGAALVIPSFWGDAVGFLKIRSGTRGQPVKQPAARLFALALQTEATVGPLQSR